MSPAHVELTGPLIEGERLIRSAAQSLDLTLIYHTHGTAEDAAQSTAYIGPDSVVFLEGYAKDGGIVSFESDLQLLNGIRLKYGKDSADYTRVKQAILDSAKTFDYYVPRSPTDFTLYGMAALKSLLDKDCLIFYADHRRYEEDSGVGATAAELNQRFRDSEPHIGKGGLPEMAATDGIAAALKHLENGIHGEIMAHALRESQAVVGSLLQIDGLLQSGSQYIRKTPEGKIAAYMVYGTAHARSLTHQFISTTGLRPRIIEPIPLPEYQYIDVMGSNHDNYGRRLGHAALLSLSLDFLEGEDLETVTEAIYPELEFLNEADFETLEKFLVTCALIKREESKDFQGAYRWYLSMLRSFMPSPGDFV